MLHTKDFFGVPGIITVPWWPIKFTIAASTALCCLIFSIKVIAADSFETRKSSK